MNIATVSVRSLVEFLLRSGDIDNRRKHSSENAMQEGGRIHRKIQKSMGSDYHAEVPLSHQYLSDEGDLAIIVDGRADGILDSNPVLIDEIKGTYRRLERMDEAEKVHLAQAMCYAYIYSLQNDLERVKVQITYCNIETEEIKRFTEEYSFEDLSIFFMGLMKEYERWVRMQLEWKKVRDGSIKEVDFPFSYRKGQKELVTHVYHTIVHGKKLFLEAATGVGKTMATLFPSVKAIGEGKAERIFYLTAKTITRTVAENAFSILRGKGLHFKSVVITAKDKICFMEERNCNPEACPYAKGHFDRINEALFAILNEQEIFSREIIEEYAEKYKVCPFELCLDISLFSDGVICDYNYAFDPHVYLRRFFAEGKKSDCIFLIDEAHNLIDRGRTMFSAELVKEDFLSLKKEIKVYDDKLAKRLERCNHEMLALKRNCSDLTKFDDISAFIRCLERLYDKMSDYLENHDSSPVRDDVLDFFFEVSHFLMIYEIMDEKYITYGCLLDNGDFSLRLFCIDPSTNLAGCMERAVSSVLFSATLLPITYHKRLLGGDESDYEVYAESSFDSKKRGLFISNELTSKYTERGANMYRLIADNIADIVRVKNGNYMAFFPSYSFMDRVVECYEEKYGDDEEITCVIQSSKMTETEREEFLRKFENGENKGSLVGFCVLGGIFSEGIDLKNESLIGAMIIGTGIPMVCRENELIKQYFDEKEDSGLAYAYIYPGFNKVLQAAGRVIRTADDVGIVALMDYRFMYNSYREMFPREWNDYSVINRTKIQDVLSDFWSQHNT